MDGRKNDPVGIQQGGFVTQEIGLAAQGGDGSVKLAAAKRGRGELWRRGQVTGECQAVVSTRADGDDVGEARWDSGLAIAVVTLTGDGAISAEGEIEIISGRDRDDVRQSGRQARLSIVIATPGHDVAILPER